MLWDNDLSPAVVSRSHAANRMQPTKAQRNHRPQAAEAVVGSRPSAWWSARLVRPWSVPQGCQQGARRPPTPQSAPSANWLLLMVETSRTMQSPLPEMLKVTTELLRSGMDGQLRSGDTLGLWTFNAHLYAGQFPLQDWTPAFTRAALSTIGRAKSKSISRHSVRHALRVEHLSQTVSM